MLTTSEALNVNEENVEDPEIILTEETKVILGYKCKKAIVTNPNGMQIDYWYTDEIQTVATNPSDVTAKLPGVCLKYYTDTDGMLMTFTATLVEESLDKETLKEKFTMEFPDGYKEMSYEEFSTMGSSK